MEAVGCVARTSAGKMDWSVKYTGKTLCWSWENMGLGRALYAMIPPTKVWVSRILVLGGFMREGLENLVELSSEECAKCQCVPGASSGKS